MVLAFTMLGLIEAHAVFYLLPLLIAACPAPCWARKSAGVVWAAIGGGVHRGFFFWGLIILQQVFGVFRGSRRRP